MNKQVRVVGDSWYADALDNVQSLDSWLADRPARRRVARWGVVRGLLLFVLGRGADVVVTTNPNPGTRFLMVLSALIGRRNVVLLEYIVHPPDSGVRRWVWRLRRWATSRAVLWMQVLSDAELRDYPRVHDVPDSRFRLIRWPNYSQQLPLRAASAGGPVFVSGRRVDWPTVFDAARGSGWDLQVVCAAADEAQVRKLDQDNKTHANISVEVSQDAHLELLAQASVYVIAVPETGSRIGQIRVMNAIDAGVAVVASDVVGLRGYLTEHTASLVPVQDSTAMRRAVDELLQDPTRRDELRNAARAAASTDMRTYLSQISDQLHHGGLVER